MIECTRDAWEEDPDGLCILHSRNADKDHDGKFKDSIKKKMDEEDYDFHGGFFPGSADFSGQKFTKKADFSYAVFHYANFFGASFQEADFRWASFQIARFPETTFQRAIFPLAWFTEANFTEATFQEADFFRATFEEAQFSGAKINGRMTLGDIRLREPLKKNQPCPLGLQSIQFGEKGILRLVNLSLAQANFYGTDLRRVEFDRVTWASWWWRAAVYDEALLHWRRWTHIAYLLNHGGLWGKKIPGEEGRPRKPSFADFAPVERLYRQLKANYEEERDFKRVGDFHYGEMEMHRRGSFWRQWMPSWYNLYRVLSGYGERPLRAFIWLLLLIPAWAGLVWWLGINQAGSQNPINYWDTLLFIFREGHLAASALGGY